MLNTKVPSEAVLGTTSVLHTVVVVTCSCLIVVQKGNEALEGGLLKSFLPYKSEERVLGLVSFPVALGATLDPARQGGRQEQGMGGRG